MANLIKSFAEMLAAGQNPIANTQVADTGVANVLETMVSGVDINEDTSSTNAAYDFYFTGEGYYLGKALVSNKENGTVRVVLRNISEAQEIALLNSGKYDWAKLKNEGIDMEIAGYTFQRFAGMVYEEEHTTMEGSYAIANATINFLRGYNTVRNLTPSNSAYLTIKRILESKYSSATKNPLKFDNNNPKTIWAYAGIINAMLLGTDYSNGAVLWDGFDFAAKGFKHIKPRTLGIHITSSEHLNGYVTYWSKPNLIKAYSNGAYEEVSADFSKNTILEPYPATEGNSKNRILCKSSEQKGGTIFWAPYTENANNNGYNWSNFYFINF
jgi:hypothetical protein